MARRVWPTLALVIIVAASLPLISRLTPEEIVRLTPESSMLAASVLLLLYVFKTVTIFMPQVILYMAAGLLFAPLWAVLITLTGMFVEFSLGYYMGRVLGREKVLQRLQKSRRGQMVLGACEDNSIASAFLPRFIPTPTDLGSMFFGAIGMNFGYYLQGSFLGLLPRAIPYVLLGDSLTDPGSAEFAWAAAVIAVVYVTGGILLYRINKRKQAR